MLEREREQVVDQARRLRPDGLVVGMSGNLSVRFEDLVAVTPSAVDYGALEPELVCVVDLDGHTGRGLASSHHRAPRAPCRVPAHERGCGGPHHSPYATVVATVVDVVPPIHYLVAALGGPVPVAPYATPGTQELADAVASALTAARCAAAEPRGAHHLASRWRRLTRGA